MYIGLAAEGDVILSTKDFVKILSSELGLHSNLPKAYYTES